MSTRFRHVAGTVVNSQKRYQSHGGGIAATLHVEFWLKASNGKETHVHLINDDVPLRKGQSVEVIFLDGTAVGIVNYTTEQYINLQPVWCEVEHRPAYSKYALVIYEPRWWLVGSIALVLIGLAVERYQFLGVVVVAGIISYAAWESWRHRKQPPKVVVNDLHGVVETIIQETLEARRCQTTPS